VENHDGCVPAPYYEEKCNEVRYLEKEVESLKAKLKYYENTVCYAEGTNMVEIPGGGVVREISPERITLLISSLITEAKRYKTYSYDLEVLLRRLLNSVNKVTAMFRHRGEVVNGALVELVEKQIYIEKELANYAKKETAEIHGSSAIPL
jgi:hypothetical protein